MRMTGRRESSNVNDRRGGGGGMFSLGKLGIGGVAVVAIVVGAGVVVEVAVEEAAVLTI